MLPGKLTAEWHKALSLQSKTDPTVLRAMSPRLLIVLEIITAVLLCVLELGVNSQSPINILVVSEKVLASHISQGQLFLS